MKKLACTIVILSFLPFLISQLYAKVDGTTGTPLGGLGTGAIKYCASNGTFFFNDQTPTRYGDYKLIPETQFQLFTKRDGLVQTVNNLKAVSDLTGRIDDDAVYPIHRVNHGTLNGVQINLNAFAPFIPLNADVMSTPCAYYEFTMVNSGSSEVEISIAFQLTTTQNPIIISGKGFADQTSQHQKSVFVFDSTNTSMISVGSGNAFFQSGICENVIGGNVNRTAAYFKIPPGEKKIVTFILAWFNNSDPSRYFYTNSFKNVSEAATFAINNLKECRNNALSFVNRMRASNLPSWLIDQTLNSLVNIVNNSIYTADGRYCHNEGMYQMNGTMDQMWHARQINTQLLPDIAWKELEYWGSCQKQSTSAVGQIHHDFGSNNSYSIAKWNESEYSDYRNIDHWVDLNCGFIISVYEAYIATADRAKLEMLWPYVKKAGQRILDLVILDGSSLYPYTFSTSYSSYDAGGDSQAYNSGLSVVAYKLMQALAGELKEPDLITKYSNACNTAIDNFSKRWLEKPVASGNYAESILGGPWIANFLKLDQYWPSNKLDNLFTAIVTYYNPINIGLGYVGGSYSEWQTYLIAHLGGYALQTGHDDVWYALQHDMYERNYLDRNRVFNQPLGIPSKVSKPNYSATDASGSNQYISIPVVWRNYFDIAGYHRNKVTGEIWLEPNLPAELNHSLINASVFTPEGYSTINATESGSSWQNQSIKFAFDQSIQVNTIYVKDKYADSIKSVTVNGIQQTYTRVGTGHQKRLKINWSGTVGHTGLNIDVIGNPLVMQIPASPNHLKAVPRSQSRIDLSWHNNSPDETGFNIECKIGGVFILIGTVSSKDTTFTHSALLQNTEYTYRVSAFNGNGNSVYSEEVKTSTWKVGNGALVIALNAGGTSYTAKDGIQYISDNGVSFCSGGSIYSTSSEITNTDDKTLYQSERYGNFTYNIPCDNGRYEVTLKFAEIYQTTPGSRIFDVSINDSITISNFDIFKVAGSNSAYDVTVPVTVLNKILKIDFKSTIDNAKLNALTVRKVAQTDIKASSQIPISFSLSQNYPNPFNPSTVINFSIPQNSNVVLKIYDILGREVATLIDGYKTAGYYTIKFDGRGYANGIYFYKMTADNFTCTKKLVLMK